VEALAAAVDAAPRAEAAETEAPITARRRVARPVRRGGGIPGLEADFDAVPAGAGAGGEDA
jgi:hypothetical protein